MGDKHDLNTYYISIELKYQISIYIINKLTKQTQAALVLSVVGISNTLGRIVSGWELHLQHSYLAVMFDIGDMITYFLQFQQYFWNILFP